jgi:hypothetical protein
MAHRKSPRGFLRNLLWQKSFFDSKSGETISLACERQVSAVLAVEFPGLTVGEVLPEAGVLVEGLVLCDRYGSGVLQDVSFTKNFEGTL